MKLRDRIIWFKHFLGIASSFSLMALYFGMDFFFAHEFKYLADY